MKNSPTVRPMSRGPKRSDTGPLPRGGGEQRSGKAQDGAQGVTLAPWLWSVTSEIRDPGLRLCLVVVSLRNPEITTSS